MKRLMLILMMGLALGAPADSLAQEEAGGGGEQTVTLRGAETPTGEGLRFNFRDVPLNDVLDYLSQSAGFVIVREADVQGRIDVVSHQALSTDEAAALVDKMLGMQGYAAIRDGRTLSIVTRDEARTRDLPVRTGSNPELIPRSDQMVTQVIPVRYADAAQMLNDIQPLLPEYATATANQSSNAIVLTDTETNIRRIANIVQALDTSISQITTIQVFTLHNAYATQVATMINQLFTPPSSQQGQRGGGGDPRAQFFAAMRGGGPQGGGGQGGAAQSEARQAAIRVTAVADERTNSVVVSAPDELHDAIADVVNQIDSVDQLNTEIRLYPLRNADAGDLADQLNRLYQNSAPGARSAQRGAQGGVMRPGGMAGQSASQREMLQTQVFAVADTRTNAVIVTAIGEVHDQIEQIVARIDNNPARQQRVFVYQIENADPSQVTEMLQGMFGSGGGRNTQRNTGAAAQRNTGNNTQRNTGTNNNNTNRTGNTRTNTTRTAR